MSRISLVILVLFTMGAALFSSACATTSPNSVDQEQQITPPRVIQPKRTITTKQFLASDGKTVLLKTTEVVDEVTESAREGSKQSSLCWLIPGCNESNQEYDRNGNVIATHSQEGFNPLTLIFGSRGQSVSSARIGNATARSLASHGNIRNAIAKRVELGDTMTDAIPRARISTDNIAGSFGEDSSSRSRVDIRRETREEALKHISPQFHKYY